MRPVAGPDVVGRAGRKPAGRREHAVRGPDVHAIAGPAQDEWLKVEIGEPSARAQLPGAVDASELFDTSSVAAAENLAPPRNVSRLTQTNVFRSIITALLPVSTTSPAVSFDSSRALKMNRFEYVRPEAGMTPALIALIPVG